MEVEAVEDAVLRRADALLYGIAASPTRVEMNGNADVSLIMHTDVDTTRSAACNPNNKAASKNGFLKREDGEMLERRKSRGDNVETMEKESMESKNDIDGGDDVTFDLKDDVVSLGKLLVAVDAAALRLFGKSIRGWKLHVRGRRGARRAMHVFAGACASLAVLRRCTYAWRSEAQAATATRKALGRASTARTMVCFKPSARRPSTVVKDVVARTTEEEAPSSSDVARQQETATIPQRTRVNVIACDESFVKRQRARDEAAKERRNAREARDAARKQRLEDARIAAQEREQRAVEEERLLRIAARKESLARREEAQAHADRRRELARSQAELAAVHYARARLRFDGLEPWLALYRDAQERLSFARAFKTRRDLASSFRAWQTDTRAAKARPLTIMKRRVMYQWFAVAADARGARAWKVLQCLKENVATSLRVSMRAEMMRFHSIAAPVLHRWVEYRMESVLERETRALVAVCGRYFAEWRSAASASRLERSAAEKRAVLMAKAEALLRQHRKEKKETTTSTAAKALNVTLRTESSSTSTAALSIAMKERFSNILHRQSLVS